MVPKYAVALRNARMHINYAGDELQELKEQKDTKKLWRNWSTFLENYVKAVGAMRYATNTGPQKKWSDELIHEQKTDEVLNYAFQARHADNHSMDTPKETENRHVRVGDGIVIQNGNDYFIDCTTVDRFGNVRKIADSKIIVVDGKIIEGSIFNKSQVREVDHFVKLSTIENRGSNYPVPNPDTAPEKQALEIAGYVYEWLKKKLSEADTVVSESK